MARIDLEFLLQCISNNVEDPGSKLSTKIDTCGGPLFVDCASFSSDSELTRSAQLREVKTTRENGCIIQSTQLPLRTRRFPLVCSHF
jgi:hypothetical protein